MCVLRAAEEMMAGMAHSAVVVPSTSYGVATRMPSTMPSSRCPRVKVVVKKKGLLLRCGFVVGERASFAASEARLWSAVAGGKRKRRNGERGRACVCMAADYYATLGIPKSATKSEIKSAYRKLARKVSVMISLSP